MSPGATFERVYRTLKDQLGSGRFAAGEHLEPAVLSQDLHASITPVRDALHRLVGEGLVEAPRGDGFRMPLITEAGLRHLYRWNAALLNLASRPAASRPEPPDREPLPAGGLLERTEQLFVAIAERSANPEHVAAIIRLNERLRVVRRLELGLLPQTEAEIAQLVEALHHHPRGGLRRAIAFYHRTRERRAAELVEALHGPR